MQKFIDREKELRLLRKAYGERPGLVVVYGRRRAGKTRLVVEWLQGLRGPKVYYHAVPASHEVNLRGLAQAISSQLGLRVFEKTSFETLDALLEMLSEMRRNTVVVIDEITYWIRGSPRVVGELQRFVDHILPGTGMQIVVVGSLIGVMTSSVLGGSAPLYGRASLRLRVEPLEPWHTPLFHPWLSLEDALRVYGLFGGIPYYHSLVPLNAGLDQVLREVVLSPSSPLRDEVFFLLRDELRNPAPYLSILEAIASGKTRASEIAQYTGIPVQHLPRYLSVLEMLGLVERTKPLGSKRGWYRLRDYAAKTWFTIIRPLEHLQGAEPDEEMVRKAREILEKNMGEVWEDIAHKYVKWLRAVGRIRYTKMGRWLRKGVEIDIIAVDEETRTVHAFEVKWSDLSAQQAKRIAKKLGAKIGQTPYADWEAEIHIIARNAPRIEEATIHTIRDMPFKKPGAKQLEQDTPEYKSLEKERYP